MSTQLTKYLGEITNKSRGGKYAEALALCEVILEQYPDSYEVYEARSEVHYRMGEYENAMSDLEYVIKLMPNEVSPIFRRGRWKLNRGDYEGAIADLSRIIESGSAYFLDSAYYFRAVALLCCGEYSEALSDSAHVPDDFFIGPNMMSKSELIHKATKGLSKPRI